MNSKDRKARAEAVRALRGKGIGVDVRRRQILRVYGTPRWMSRRHGCSVRSSASTSSR